MKEIEELTNIKMASESDDSLKNNNSPSEYYNPLSDDLFKKFVLRKMCSKVLAMDKIYNLADYNELIMSFASDEGAPFTNGYVVYVIHEEAYNLPNATRSLLIVLSRKGYHAVYKSLYTKVYSLYNTMCGFKKNINRNWQRIKAYLECMFLLPMQGRKKINSFTALAENTTVKENVPVLTVLKTDCVKCPVLRKSFRDTATLLKAKLTESRTKLKHSLNCDMKHLNQSLKRKDAIISKLKTQRRLLRKENLILRKKINSDDIKNINKMQQMELSLKEITADYMQLMQDKDRQIIALQQQISDLHCQLDSFKVKDLKCDLVLKSKTKKQYNTPMRKCIYTCLLNHVPVQRTGHVIETVVKELTQMRLDEIPGPTTIAQMAYEISVISDLQVAEQLYEASEAVATLSWDSTTIDGCHINEFHISINGKSLTLNINKLSSGRTEDYFEHIKNTIQDLAETYSTFSNIHQHLIMYKFREAFNTTLSDRARVNHCINSCLSELLGKELVELKCNLHPLDGLASEARKVLKKIDEEKSIISNIHGTEGCAANLVYRISKLSYQPDSGQYNITQDSGSDSEDDSLCEGEDGHALGQKYSVTPPSIPRSRIREKERNGVKNRNTDRSYKEFLISKRQQQPKTVNVIKNEYVTDPALCSLTEFDSDDNLDMEVIKERREKKRRETKVLKKTLSMIRYNDRQEKRLSEDFSLLNVNDPLEQTPMTVNFEGSGRFPHIRKKPVPISTGSLVRQQVAEVPLCQKDREEFYTNFSLLISLGTEAKKDKEKKMSSSKRQISVEVSQWQTAMAEQVWIELQAYINGKLSPEEQLDSLKKERQLHEHVIDDINKFCFTDALTTEECPDSAFVRDSSMSNGFFGSSNPKEKTYKELVSRSVSASFSEVNLTNDVVCLQVKALIQVQKLLERLDHYESCFNTTKACEKENKKYMDPEFQRRVKCLNLWLNITCDLCQKLKLFGKIICAHSRGISWPLLNFEFPKSQPVEFLACQRASLPNVLETEPTDCSDVDETDDSICSKKSDKEFSEIICASGNRIFLSPNRKQVKFQFGDESNSDQGSPTGSPLTSSPSNYITCSTPVREGDTSCSAPTASYSSVLGSSQSNFEDSQQYNSSLYRHYVEKCLRKMGLQRLNVRLRNLFHRSLGRAKEALQRPKYSNYTDIAYAEKVAETVDKQEEFSSISSSGPCSTEDSSRPSLLRGSSLSEHGEWSSQFIEMGLPSFRPTYLYIVRIQLDVIHECLKLRKDQRPIGDPSFLSIRQLIRECKEVLKGATMVKQYYHYMVDAVMWDEQEAEAKLETDLYEFDEDMKSMLDVYFNYLQNWIYMLQSLPQASLGMKSALEEEWTFTKSICAYIIGGEATAAKKFSSLASSLLNSIADFVDKGIDDNTRNLFDEGFDNEENSEENEDEYSDENENVENKTKSQKMAEMKSNVQVILRNFKNLFNEARERSSKALGFAKLLRKDLEVAADYDISVTTKELFTKLKETRHVQLCAPLSSGYMMFIPEKILTNNQLVLQLLNVTCGREDKPEKSLDLSKHTDPAGSSHSNPSGKEDGYLLMVRCENGQDHEKECPRWTGFKMQVEPTAETAIALSHIEVMGLLFVVTNSGSLAAQRKTFESIMGKTIQLVNEQTSCHQSIAESFSELKTNAVELMVKLAQNIQQVNEKLNFNEVIQHEENILKLYRETMLKIYDFGFEYQRELMRLISRDQREKMCHMSVNFVQDWMAFVIKRCERGRGTRPRWATQGLEFIALACEPKNIVYLTDQEFQNFQHNIHNSLSHIIGSSENRSVGHGLSLSRSNLDLSRTSQPSMQRLTSCPEPPRINRSVSARSVQSEPTSGHLSSTGSTPLPGSTPFFGDSRGTRYSIPELPEISVKKASDGQIYLEFVQARRGSRAFSESSKPRSERLQTRIERLENDRQEKLREKRIIGHVTTRVQEPDYRINVRRVNFRWQRGIKIGEGQFGKVYTAVNINTGELMAMKEMKFQPNDQQSLKEICDEIKNFEGINHKNLVRYYGVEVHKDEMLMFMEYCDSGSIEEVARIGLPEYMIRRYTHEIVHAIAHLHENNIVHRDIKGANIFLTSQGHVKLGDFGCSVKLKSQQTMPGENINLVGTTAYMAPEVITQNKQEGYGRAADIWSLGCVVIEMATGKRPWHELEHNLQVMFKVGMGHTPPIPEGLGKEGKNFLNHCLVHEPLHRYTAAQLLDHIFVKYECEVEENDSDED